MPFRSIAATLCRKDLGAALLSLALLAPPAQAGEFTDAAGRRVALPERIGRVLPAGPSADVLVYVLAPDKLLGWSRPPQRRYLTERFARLPVLGRLNGPNPSIGAGTVRRLRPDLIIDAGAVSPERAAFADQMQQQTGVPYLLVDDSFARMPEVLRSLAIVLGVADRGGDVALGAEHAIAAIRGRLLLQPGDQRPRVYYGRGALGLETVLPGSPAGQAIDEAGAVNVAAALGRGARTMVTREQLLGWNPDVIIAQEPSFYDALQRTPGWRQLKAVRDKRVFLEPGSPFGWIDDPPGVNRLVGLYWLSGVLYPDPTQADVRTAVSEFYSTFYRVKLTDAQLASIARSAGIPPSDTMNIAGTVPGLGAPGTAPGLPSLVPSMGLPEAMPAPGRRGAVGRPGAMPVGPGAPGTGLH